MTKKIIIALIVIVMTAASIFAAADAPAGSTVSAGAGATYTPAVNPVTAEGGNYSELNASGAFQTDNWQVFFGNVTSTINLQDGSNNIAYTWGTTNPSGYIFFANSSTIDWTNIQGSNVTLTPLADENTNLALGNATDNMTNTVVDALGAHPMINYTTLPSEITSTWAFQTNNGAAAATWWTALTWDGTDKAYCGFLDQGGETSFMGNEADYQVMLPTGNAANRQYFVYLAVE